MVYVTDLPRLQKEYPLDPIVWTLVTKNELNRFTGGDGLAAQDFESIDQNYVAFIPGHLRTKAQQKRAPIGWLDPILNVKLFDIIPIHSLRSNCSFRRGSIFHRINDLHLASVRK